MIRSYRPTDLDKVVNIWYEASKIAHSFISEEALASQKKLVINTYLPVAETWVSEEDGELVGFISLLENMVGGLFVSPLYQGTGTGTKLIEHARSLRGSLSVEVFKENIKARKFYEKCGFILMGERLEENTGFPLLVMRLD